MPSPKAVLTLAALAMIAPPAALLAWIAWKSRGRL